MRRFAIATIAVLLMVLVGAAPSGARTRRAAPAKCPPANGEVLVADAQAEVYTVVKLVDKYYYREQVRGCTYKDRHSYELGSFEPECTGSSQLGGGCGGLALEALAGPIVAYAESEGSKFGSKDLVFVRDLRNGRVLQRVPTGVRAKPSPQNVGTGSATAIVVKSDGAVAWIAENEELSAPGGHPEDEPKYYEVHVVDKTGSRLLAAGVNIEPSSLALAGSTLYWMQGGKPASAVLN